MNQVSLEVFSQALVELGHNPEDYIGKRISLSSMTDLYELKEQVIIDAIDKKQIAAHYDYKNDTIWFDALDAAHFYYCVTSQQTMSF